MSARLEIRPPNILDAVFTTGRKTALAILTGSLFLRYRYGRRVPFFFFAACLVVLLRRNFDRLHRRVKLALKGGRGTPTSVIGLRREAKEGGGGNANGQGGRGGVAVDFWGIPFAKPPVGKLRFAAPQPLDATIGELDCTANAGKPSHQLRLGIEKFVDNWVDGVGMSALRSTFIKYMVRLLVAAPAEESEDCLTLSVRTPLDAVGDMSRKLPVMVWIHGGDHQVSGGWAGEQRGGGWGQAHEMSEQTNGRTDE